jgi:hypothetical protein
MGKKSRAKQNKDSKDETKINERRGQFLTALKYRVSLPKNS